MVWWKHNRQACQSGQAEGPMPTPLPCPLCNGHAEAVMDSWTSGGYGYDFERWGCRCGECGYGYYGGNPLSPSDERQAIERWDQQVEEALKIIAEPLEEMPVMPLRPEGREKRQRGIPPMPGMPQNRTRRQPHRDQGQVEPLVPSAEGDEAQSQTTGRAVGTNHRKGRGVMDANSIIWVCAIICVVCAFINASIR